MPALFKKRSAVYSPLGLDLGQTGARAVQLKQSDGCWTVHYAASWPFRQADRDGLAFDALSDRLGRARSNQEFIGRSVVLGLSQPDVEINALELPAQQPGTEKSQLASAARWEIERLTRFDDQAIQTDLWWLPAGKGSHPTAMGVAVPTQTMQGIWQTCRRAGAHCQSVDVAACFLSRAGLAVRPAQPQEVWGLLDVGARGTRLVLCIGEVAVLARTLGDGSCAWTQKLAATLQVSETSAEQHKRDHGIASLRPSKPPGQSPPLQASCPSHSSQLADMVFTALRQDLDRISQEITRSYEYVLQCYPGHAAGCLLLTGAGAALIGLDTYLSDRLGIDAILPDHRLNDPHSRLLVGDTFIGRREPLSAFMGAIGLAIQPGGTP